MSETPRIVVSGASGFIGSALSRHLRTNGYRIVRLVRPGRESGADVLRWLPDSGPEHPEELEGAAGIVHLAGENLSAGRWTRRRKAKIRDSRIRSTERLAESMARLERPPRAFLSASAIGFYGDRGEEVLDEEGAPGRGFLAELCRDWEDATGVARAAGIRVANLRIGLVVGRGGLLAKLELPFRLGLGGRLGSGRQYMSWIALDDLTAAVLHVLRSEPLTGPVNLVAPKAVTNREFTRALGHVLHRPTPFPVPRLALRLLMGELGDESLASQRVIPKRLTEQGFLFRYGELVDALRRALAS